LCIAIYLIDFIEKHHHIPAFWIAMAVFVPSVLAFQWMREKKAQEVWAGEQHCKLVEELSRDPADALALELYLSKRGSAATGKPGAIS